MAELDGNQGKVKALTKVLNFAATDDRLSYEERDCLH